MRMVNYKAKHPIKIKEELSNTVTHSIGFILSIIGAIVVIINACLKSGSFTYVVSAVIFGL